MYFNTYSNPVKSCHQCVFVCLFSDDLWVISQEMTFDPSCTFLAKSIYHGPSSCNDIEIEPVSSYSPSNWPSSGKSSSMRRIGLE